MGFPMGFVAVMLPFFSSPFPHPLPPGFFHPEGESISRGCLLVLKEAAFFNNREAAVTELKASTCLAVSDMRSHQWFPQLPLQAPEWQVRGTPQGDAGHECFPSKSLCGGWLGTSPSLPSATRTEESTEVMIVWPWT